MKYSKGIHIVRGNSETSTMITYDGIFKGEHRILTTVKPYDVVEDVSTNELQKNLLVSKSLIIWKGESYKPTKIDTFTGVYVIGMELGDNILTLILSRDQTLRMYTLNGEYEYVKNDTIPKELLDIGVTNELLDYVKLDLAYMDDVRYCNEAHLIIS